MREIWGVDNTSLGSGSGRGGRCQGVKNRRTVHTSRLQNSPYACFCDSPTNACDIQRKDLGRRVLKNGKGATDSD